MFAGLQMVLKLRSFKVCMKASRVGEHGTANPISIALFSQKLLHLKTRAFINNPLRLHVCAYVRVCVKPEGRPATELLRQLNSFHISNPISLTSI